MRRPEIVQAMQNVLRKVAPEATVILYGSEARGDARPDSDIDLLILVNKDQLPLSEQQAITYPLYDIEVETGVLINPLVLPRKQWETKHRVTPFYHNVMREGGDTMTDDDRKEIVALRLDNADSATREAKLMMENGFWNAAINRMYYACFYAVSALLVSRGIQAQTHSGVRTILSLHFVKTGILSSKYSAFFADLFAKRHSGDYDDYFYFDGDLTKALYPQTIEFIETIKQLIK